jgi:hypothetical protein
MVIDFGKNMELFNVKNMAAMRVFSLVFGLMAVS